ncbi:anti-phage deoxyguanosine triphosphatase [Paracoccus yeei]|uniref:Deoxyguanosinetriphosphate triphosphohydrolase-like protein n=1 Tax=Paracoccus yeei TaxID=147645 RepID=A0A5P2QU58_9RHOB|nr:anti-phage deoxyguanosine triphosphatase [Paracoccus yeei]QEU08926.1 dNTP triphosphohydrolase [Paracoccus yeei]
MTDWNARREGWTPQDEDARDVGDVDYARVIHSASFRRLQGKTQILNLGESDFYRTRLTHSLEVAQIAGGLARQLGQNFPEHPAAEILPDRSLIHAVACSHDLGHPPFGHGGEVSLNYCMRDAGGFEGNGQTLRLLARLENFSADAGANLSRRAMLGVLKYPASLSTLLNPAIRPQLQAEPSVLQTIDLPASTPPKGYLDCEADVVDWILDPLRESDKARFTAIERRAGKHARTLHKSLDCSIMDLADDIAYGVHDLEDAIALRLVSEGQFRAQVTGDDCASFIEARRQKAPAESNDPYEAMVSGLFGGSDSRKRWIGRMVGHLITAVMFNEKPDFHEPLLRWRVAVPMAQARFLKALKDFVMAEVIRSPGVQHLEFKGQSMVVLVFEALQSDPERLLPRDTHAKFVAADDDLRIISDFVAGMTDTYLLKTYERLFAPRMGSVFDRL